MKAIKSLLFVLLSFASFAQTLEQAINSRVVHVPTVTALSSTVGSLTGVNSIKVDDPNRGGDFIYVPTLTAFDNGLTFKAKNGGGFRRVTTGLSVNVKWFGCKGDSLTDDTALLQKTINTSDWSGTVDLPVGTYRVSSPIFTLDWQKVRFAPGAKIIVSTDYPVTFYRGNDAGYVFVLGNHSILENAVIDLKGHATGGVSLIQRIGSTATNCTVKNWVGVRFGFALIGATDCHVEKATLTDGAHGINAFRSVNCTAHNNYGNRLYSFIYEVAANGFEFNNNRGFNCEDVIFDCERGTHCHGYNNYAQGGRRGEYNLFDGGAENADQPVMSDVIFGNSVAVRTYTYQKANPFGTTYVVDSVASDWGACSVHSIAAGARNVGFENMTIYVERGYAYVHAPTPDLSNRFEFFRKNSIRSKAGFFYALDSDNLNVTHNELVGELGSEGVDNVLRDASGLICTDNTIRYVNPKTSGVDGKAFALKLQTVSGYAKKAQLVARNHFYNCNTRALQIDHFNNSSLVTTLQHNELSLDYQPNGGLDVTSNGDVVMRDQNLKILLTSGDNNLNTLVPAVAHSGTYKAMGSLVFGRVGYNGSAYTVASIFGSGTYLHKFFEANGLDNTTVSGNTITLNNQTGTTVNGYLDLTFDTINNP